MQNTLSEQEILTDLLTSEKHTASSINTFITESTCANLRQNLKDILTEEHSIHENLYNVMNQKGWYPTSDAQAQEVQKTKDKFNSLQL
ncbi:spore coat protein [Desulfosporosinus nitroreducens]|uniref:spore coat protein n=1 Tax=Desulfosporosinus nitroreducens TaxID=2018668 RepID=UPI00207C3F0D|nr:spore coat protein [Desulfosporosinus nitroreducens]MCO1601906.1 spore coat protein [Desulfosporosinus nitroreducens]